VPHHSLESAGRTSLVELRDRAAELGVEPSALIQVSRGFLFVEGTNDRWLVEHFFGDELADARVEVVVLHGGSQAPGLAEIELLWTLGKRVAVMLDNTRAEIVRRRPNKSLTPKLRREEQWLQSLGFALRRKGRNAFLIAFDLPDIVVAVPGPAIKDAIAAFGGDPSKFGGWRELREGNGKPFKLRFLERTGVEVDDVLRQLRRSGFEGPPARELKEAVALALDHFD
jgi:hypothetical protein